MLKINMGYSMVKKYGYIYKNIKNKNFINIFIMI